jgi:hypothetical protein
MHTDFLDVRKEFFLVANGRDEGFNRSHTRREREHGTLLIAFSNVVRVLKERVQDATNSE